MLRKFGDYILGDDKKCYLNINTDKKVYVIDNISNVCDVRGGGEIYYSIDDAEKVEEISGMTWIILKNNCRKFEWSDGRYVIYSNNARFDRLFRDCKELIIVCPNKPFDKIYDDEVLNYAIGYLLRQDEYSMKNTRLYDKWISEHIFDVVEMAKRLRLDFLAENVLREQQNDMRIIYDARDEKCKSELALLDMDELIVTYISKTRLNKVDEANIVLDVIKHSKGSFAPKFMRDILFYVDINVAVELFSMMKPLYLDTEIADLVKGISHGKPRVNCYMSYSNGVIDFLPSDNVKLTCEQIIAIGETIISNEERVRTANDFDVLTFCANLGNIDLVRKYYNLGYRFSRVYERGIIDGNMIDYYRQIVLLFDNLSTLKCYNYVIQEMQKKFRLNALLRYDYVNVDDNVFDYFLQIVDKKSITREEKHLLITGLLDYNQLRKIGILIDNDIIKRTDVDRIIDYIQTNGLSRDIIMLLIKHFGDEISDDNEFDLDEQCDDKKWRYEVNLDDTVTLLAYKGIESIVEIPQVVAGYRVGSVDKGCFSRDNIALSYDERRVLEGIKVVFVRDENILPILDIELVDKSGLYYRGYDGIIFLYESDNTQFQNRYLNVITGVRNVKIYDNRYIGAKLSDGNIAIVKYIGNDKNVVVPSDFEGINISQITPLAFQNAEIESVIIGDNVRSVSEGAFYNCGELREVTLGKSVEIIEEYSFFNDAKLVNLTTNTRLYRIGKYAFAYCKLGDINLPDSLTNIENKAFFKNNVEKLYISGNIEHIAGDAFDECQYLSEVTFGASHSGKICFGADEPLRLENVRCATIEEGITELPDYFFSNYVALERVNLADSIERFGDYPFVNCRSLQEITVPSGVKVLQIDRLEDNSAIHIIYVRDNLKCISASYWKDKYEIISSGYHEIECINFDKKYIKYINR